MITEDYISFETAKILKEKGFDEKCFALYNPDGILIQSGIRLNNTQVGGVKGSYSATTLQMAMKWLREVHNIDIDIDAKVGMLGRKVYLPTISTYRCREDSDRLMQKQFELRYKDDTAVVPALQYFNTYEEAAEVAIKHCLENLI